MTNPKCLDCHRQVRPRQHALCCENCERWQHRLCSTNVSLQEYWSIFGGEAGIAWYCNDCKDENRGADELQGSNPYDVSTDEDEPMEEESFQTGQIRDNTFDDSFRSVPVLESTREAEGSRNDQLMVSFNISCRAVVESSQVLEQSLEDDNPMDDTVLEDVPVTFKLLEKGSSRGGRLLVSSDGYSYSVKHEGQKTTTWTFSMRSKKIKCYASVSQQGELFVRGSSKHLHPGNLKLPHLKEISAKVKQSARENVFQSAMSIAEGTVMDHFSEETRFLAPNLHLIKRVANRFRSKFRPEEPVDLNFQMDLDFLQCEDFLVADINADGQRHIIFSSPFQLSLLKDARRWYMDGTFKVVPKVFRKTGQLMSIHAFVQQGGKKKQFPLVFALMSRRKKEDYMMVLQAILERLDEPVVEEIMLDFEKAAWQSIREVLPGISIRGCVVHWTQALWRHVQDLGLAATYREKKATHWFIKQLMALPFLPSNDINPTFRAMQEKVQPSSSLKSLTDYMERQWISNEVFPIPAWSIYKQEIRTNNDTEGWHNRLNGKAGHGNIGFYRLIPMLQKEAEIVHVQVSAQDLSRDARITSTRVEKKIRQAWADYDDDIITTSHFLRICGGVYGHTE